MGATAEERREELVALFNEVKACSKCPLHETRTKAVFGAGDARVPCDADARVTLRMFDDHGEASFDMAGCVSSTRRGNISGKLRVRRMARHFHGFAGRIVKR